VPNSDRFPYFTVVMNERNMKYIFIPLRVEGIPILDRGPS